MTIQTKIETLFSNLISKHELTMHGDPLEPKVYQVRTSKTIEVIFEDESMSHLIAGNVAGSIYDEMEAEVNKLGFTIEDTDGSTLHLSQ